MIAKIDIECHFSPALLADLRGALAAVRDKPHVKVRLVRVPVMEFKPAVDATLRQHGPIPFQPTVFGHACEPVPVERPTLVCVADDDTNFHRDAVRESEVL